TKKISAPHLFVGGLLEEKNTTKIASEAGHRFIKAPDLGRGFGEIILSTNGEGPKIGPFHHRYEAFLLMAEKIHNAECEELEVKAAKCSLSDLAPPSPTPADSSVPCE